MNWPKDKNMQTFSMQILDCPNAVYRRFHGFKLPPHGSYVVTHVYIPPPQLSVPRTEPRTQARGHPSQHPRHTFPNEEDAGSSVNILTHFLDCAGRRYPPRQTLQESSFSLGRRYMEPLDSF